MADAPMTQCPDKIGFYWVPEKDEPAEVVWVDYFAFLVRMTRNVPGDPKSNAYHFDRNLSSTFGHLVNAAKPS